VLSSEPVNQFEYDHGYFYFDYFRNLNIHVIAYFLSLAKLFRVGDFGFRNQALIVADVMTATPLLVLQFQRVIHPLLNAQVIDFAGESSIVAFQVVLLEFCL